LFRYRDAFIVCREVRRGHLDEKVSLQNQKGNEIGKRSCYAPHVATLPMPRKSASGFSINSRLLYLLHLTVILWCLLDKSPKQRATHALVSLLERILPSFGVALLLPQVRGFVRSADSLVREALFDEVA
jgi:hypothetical protein